MRRALAFFRQRIATASINYRHIFYVAGGTLALGTGLYFYLAFSFISHLDLLVDHAQDSNHVQVVWYNKIKPVRIPGREQICVRTPTWCSDASSAESQFFAAPQSYLTDVQIRRVDLEILSALADAHSLRTLDIICIRARSKEKRIEPFHFRAVQEKWNNVLRIPLEELNVANSGLPENALSLLSTNRNLKVLMMTKEGPFNAAATADLGKCSSLRWLYLGSSSFYERGA